MAINMQFIFLGIKGHYRHDLSRLSTGHGIGVLVKEEHSELTGSFMQQLMQQQR